MIQDANPQYIRMKLPTAHASPAKLGMTVGDKVTQVPISIPGHPTWPESVRASVGDRLSVNMKHPSALAFAIQSVPIKYLSSQQYLSSGIPAGDIPPYSPLNVYKMKVSQEADSWGVRMNHVASLESRYVWNENAFATPNYVPVVERGMVKEVPYGTYRIREDDLGIAATTPILGQYVPTFGWPDDWGWYWEYLDARLFVPEASFAAKIKTRMVWKDVTSSKIESCIDTDSETKKQKIAKKIRKARLIPRLIYGTHNALVWGNSYQEIVGDSHAVWGAGSSEMDYALSASGIIYGLPRPLLQYTPTSVSGFKGLKSLDPRAVRIEVHPQEFDTDNGEVYRSKYIQRRWAGPLAPTVAYPQSQQVELDFHPEQMFVIQFNRLPDGIYGYSIYRETLYALKGLLLMYQFLPQIFQKRADPLLHFKFGGNVKLPTGTEVTEIPSDEQIEIEKERFTNRMPGEDIYTKVTAEVLEVFQGARNSADLIDFLREYKERCFLGMGVPLSIAISESGQEIKWGSMKYEVAEDEVRIELQMPIEDEFNHKIMPLLGGNSEDAFVFPEISEEDQRADETWLADMFTRGMISRDYAAMHLRLPPDALKGDFIYDLQQMQMQKMQPLMTQPGKGAMQGAGGKAGPDNAQVGSMPTAPGAGKEKYRVRDTNQGYIVERYDGN